MEEIIIKAQQTAEMLVTELREIGTQANKADNRALSILTRDMLKKTIEVVITLNELH